jgi:hypothetical protein
MNEHLWHQPTPISDQAKVEFVPMGVSRQLERSSLELTKTNFELQNQNLLIMEAFRNFVRSTELFLKPKPDNSMFSEHRGWSGADDINNSGCKICLDFALALATAKFIVQP